MPLSASLRIPFIHVRQAFFEGHHIRMKLLHRYAEVLLNYAECCIRTGGAAEAGDYIRMIQERAGSKTVSICSTHMRLRMPVTRLAGRRSTASSPILSKWWIWTRISSKTPVGNNKYLSSYLGIHCFGTICEVLRRETRHFFDSDLAHAKRWIGTCQSTIWHEPHSISTTARLIKWKWD